MSVIPEDEIFQKWAARIEKIKGNGRTFNLYIDNPFCINQCQYCIHQGAHLKKHGTDFKKYYFSFLPGQIKKFAPLMETHRPDTAYFGGGSPNSMSKKIMTKIFSRIPEFNSIANKVIECNPALMTAGKLEVLKENKFTYISLGIQSLHSEILEFNGRRGYEHSKLKETIKTLQSSGTKINCDLMAFIGENRELGDVERLKKDIVRLYQDFSPDIITIYPNKKYLKKLWERNRKLGGELIIALRKMLTEARENLGLNSQGAVDKYEITDVGDFQFNYLLYSLPEARMSEIKKYNSTTPRTNKQPKSQNVLGLGGYKDHRPYSYHGRNFAYITENVNWSAVYKEI